MGSKSIVINGQLLHYYERKAEVSPRGVLLFLHGWRSDSAVWAAAMANFPGYDAYALDLPGFGSSPAPSKPWQLSDYSETVQGFCSELRLQGVTIIGHSFGGRIAIVLGAAVSPWLRALVLVNSAGIRRETSRTRVLPTLASLVRPFFRPAFMQPLRRRIYKELGAEDYVATPALQKTFVSIIYEDLSGLLPKIHYPTLLFWGGRDQETPAGDAEEMRRTIAGSRLVLVPEAGHFSFIDAPQRFQTEVKNFLESTYA